MQYNVKNLKSPLGPITFVVNETAVIGLHLNDFDPASYQDYQFNKKLSLALLVESEKQLNEYFRGQLKNFDLPLQFQGTPFQNKVWHGLQKIPYGKTWSYQNLAIKINNPKAVRAVGSANGKNPICIIIPCHRVIRHNGELGGYTGGIEIKQQLLNLESK